MKKKILIQSILTAASVFMLSGQVGAQKKMPPSYDKSKSEPVVYTGKIEPTKDFFDGSLPHAVGVHNIQVFRANRENPDDPGRCRFYL